MSRSSWSYSASFLIGGMLVGVLLASVGTVHGAMEANVADTANVDSQAIWRNATDLERLGASHPAYRCAGSLGANESAEWILSKFQDLGLAAWTEEFQFYGWDLVSVPSMEVLFQNESGEQSLLLGSFQAEHFSSATPSGGRLAEITLLPLPLTSSYGAFSGMGFDPNYWHDIDIHNRIVLVGREVRWNPQWESGLANKLLEGPAALVFYYSQAWTSPWEVMYSASSGGRPLSSEGSYLSSLNIPAGHLDSGDSEFLLDRMEEGNVTALVRVDSKQGVWGQENVVARLEGDGGSGMVLLTAHYDSVMDAGFCDNAVSVATMIEVASQLVHMHVQDGLKPASSILFVAFTGEELGLVGSDYYYAMHASEMGEVKAVINIDCLGAGTLTRSITDPSQGIDLDEMVDQAASVAGISSLVEDGASDHESFLSPWQVATQIQSRWGLSPQIPVDAIPLTSSIGVFSEPLTLMDSQSGGHLGWIHTSRDSSDFCSSSGWVSEDRLSEQGDVILAVCLDLIGAELEPTDDGMGPLSALTITVAILAVASASIILVLVLRRGRRPDR